MENKYVIIDGPDDNKISGQLRSCEASKLVIHLHGMTHNMGHYLEVSSSDYFTKHGFDHYRIGFYDFLPSSRRLTNSTLSTHTSDVRCVLDYFKPLYEEIYITAHSLSAVVCLILNPNVAAMSLWDPATDVTNFWKKSGQLSFMPERKQYQVDYGNIFVISEDMVQEIAQYPDTKCRELAAKIKTPTQFIVPEISIFKLSGSDISAKAYKDAFQGPFDLQEIPKANHTFANPEHSFQLFEKTRLFFENINKKA